MYSNSRNEAATTAPPAAVGALTLKPGSSSRASAPASQGSMAISKEDERRLKLQHWQESKASERSKKLIGAPERVAGAAANDRKAQFFERRERRLQEEEQRRRISRQGKENNTPMTTSVSKASRASVVGVACGICVSRKREAR